ncbi:hypothetical protein ABZ845_02680 [Streptomyces sp. NPDC047022]|uniref:hypothetical protein n=1 Tax=Streptomyces sp. NPDC047022 TaxID=3155737 RepID=UPI0033D379A3
MLAQQTSTRACPVSMNAPHVVDSPWTALTRVEHDLMVSATEASGILAYATNSKDEDGHAVDLQHIVLGLVDRGWVHVHRLERWTSPDGQAGATYGPPIPRAEIPAGCAA